VRAARGLSLPLALLLAWLAAGCAAAPPPPLEGTVRHKDRAKGGAGGSTITVLTHDGAGARPFGAIVSKEALGALVHDLEALGLFGLRGRPDAPAELPPGTISVDVTGRKFTVGARDLTTPEESAAFSRSIARIIEATQAGPRFTLSKD